MSTLRTYKSIERPSQILGIDLNNLFLVMGFILGSALAVAFLTFIMSIPWWVYILLLVISIGLFLFFKYLSKHRPPGYAQGFLSFHTRQPHRLSIGLRRPAHVVRKK